MELTLVIPPEIAIPDPWKPLIFAQAAGSEKRRPMAIGETCELGGPQGTLFMLRQDETTLVVSRDPLKPEWVAPNEFAWADPLWRELDQSAPTPAERRALAESMVPRLPCGPCRKGWRAVLRELTDEHLATDDAFRRWCWARRQDIAESKGKPRWSFPG